MYSQTQSVFALSLMSNLGWNCTGTVEEIAAATLKAINTELGAQEPYMGEWSVTWGPAIYQAPNSNVADNVMVVFEAGNGALNPGQIVVGIAGTNVYSAFDWLMEDFLVAATVPWETADTSLNPRVSLGTAAGLAILLFTAPVSGMPGAGKLLPEFFTFPAKGANITIAGHSLGGALSPAMALFLSDTKKAWDPLDNSTLFCVPSAGPTSGNQDFATYYDSQLGSATSRLWNPLDVVPHAWNKSDMQEIADLYAPAIPEAIGLLLLLLAGLAISLEGNYTQINQSEPPLTGSALNTVLITPGQSQQIYCDNYKEQAIYQHVQAYFTLVGVNQTSGMAALVPTAAVQRSTLLQNAVNRKLAYRKALTASAAR